jgi:hypothetical protein
LRRLQGFADHPGRVPGPLKPSNVLSWDPRRDLLVFRIGPCQRANLLYIIFSVKGM